MRSVLCVVVGVSMLYPVGSYAEEAKRVVNTPLLIHPHTTCCNNLQVAAINVQPLVAAVPEKQVNSVDFFFSKQTKGTLVFGLIPFPAIYGESVHGSFRFIAGTTGQKTAMIVEYRF